MSISEMQGALWAWRLVMTSVLSLEDRLELWRKKAESSRAMGKECITVQNLRTLGLERGNCGNSENLRAKSGAESSMRKS